MGGRQRGRVDRAAAGRRPSGMIVPGRLAAIRQGGGRREERPSVRARSSLRAKPLLWLCACSSSSCGSLAVQRAGRGDRSRCGAGEGREIGAFRRVFRLKAAVAVMLSSTTKTCWKGVEAHNQARTSGRASAGPHQGDSMDRIKITGGQAPQRLDSHLRRQERGAAVDDREPADTRPADAEERSQPRRRQSARPHPAQPRRRFRRRRQARRPRRAHRRDLPLLRARHRRHGGALRDGEPHARQLLGAGAAARALRPGEGVAARRLRHRHAPRRPAPDGLEGARRRDRDRERLRRRQGARRPARRAASCSRRCRWAPPTTCCSPLRSRAARP